MLLYSLKSSVNIRKGHLIIYISNSNGLKFEPCGTPLTYQSRIHHNTRNDTLFNKEEIRRVANGSLILK